MASRHPSGRPAAFEATKPMLITKNTVGAALFLLVLVSLWTPAAGLPGAVTLLRYAVFVGLSGFITLYAYLTRGFRVPLGSEAALVGAFLFYVALSALWSTRDADTYIKSFLILSTLLMAVSLANVLPLDRILRIIFAALVAFIAASAVTAIAVPSVGLEDSWEHAGKWRGLSGQKNILGNVAALCLMLALGLPIGKQRLRGTVIPVVVRTAIVLLSALVVYMSGSRGAQLMSFIAIASLLVARLSPLLRSLLILGVLFFSVPLINLAVTTFYIDSDKIGVAGFVINTNSRTTIWEYGLTQMQGHEFLGYGVNGFWTPQRMLAFKDVHGWVLDNFHNGYITIVVEGGFVGIALLTGGLILTYLLLMMSLNSLRDPYVATAFAFMNVFVMNNLVENTLGRSTSLSIIMFALIVFSLRAYVSSRLGVRDQTPAYPIPPAPRWAR